jgi:hypothetical protein
MFFIFENSNNAVQIKQSPNQNNNNIFFWPGTQSRIGTLDRRGFESEKWIRFFFTTKDTKLEVELEILWSPRDIPSFLLLQWNTLVCTRDLTLLRRGEEEVIGLSKVSDAK